MALSGLHIFSTKILVRDFRVTVYQHTYNG